MKVNQNFWRNCKWFVSALLLIGNITSCKQKQPNASSVQQQQVENGPINPSVKNITKSMVSSKSNYCVAIRGNGERIPAHWGGMARLVENFGMPVATAGGSSASITQFLLESIQMNSIANEMDNDHEAKAFLIKSLQEFLVVLGETEEVKSVRNLLSDQEFMGKLKAHMNSNLSAGSTDGLSTVALASELRDHLPKVQKLLTTENQSFKGLINPDFIKYVEKTVVYSQPASPDAVKKQLPFRLKEIRTAVEKATTINASGDPTLFFRNSLVSFDGLAQLMGVLGDFYAMTKIEGLREDYQEEFRTVLKKCSAKSKNILWGSPGFDSDCQKSFNKLMKEYYNLASKDANTISTDRRINQPISKHLYTFVATSIVGGESMTEYLKLKKAYESNVDPDFGAGFRLKDKNDLLFGYWGVESFSGEIGKAFDEKLEFKNDFKSQKFQNLWSANAGQWIDAISRSAAEPGLSNVRDMPKHKDTYLSFGGWNDLHPTLVLRAAGCENVVYLTRKGEDSKFGQDVFQKLTGDKSEAGSDWHKMYDLSNKKSSFYKSIEEANLVYCTNWDKKPGIAGIVDAYKSPIYGKSLGEFSGGTINFLENGTEVGCTVP